METHKEFWSLGNKKKKSSEEKEQYQMNTGKDETSKAGSCNMSKCYKIETWLWEKKEEKFDIIWKSQVNLFSKE